MNRREFLKTTFGACSIIYFGKKVITVDAMASEGLAQLLNISSGFKSITPSQQNYFSLEFVISSECEIIQNQTSHEFVFLIKNCQIGDLAGQMNYTNPYIKQVEVKKGNQEDCLIRLIVKDQKVVPEIRYALIPSVLTAGRYCLRIDVGSFSGPAAIKEKNLGIQETNLTFRSLKTRAFTDLIVIHHVGLRDADVGAAEIHRLHLAKEWSGIGYHYVVRKNGMIERGRPRDAVGAHTYQYNESSIGIVLDGNFENSMPTDAQLESAAMLVAALSHIYTIYPDDNKLLGHRDLKSTLCPGKNLYIQLPQIRDKAIAYLQQ